MTVAAGRAGNALSLALMTAAQMREAERLTVAAGTPEAVLMERAGAAVAEAIARRWPPGRVLVLCGPGNNGGDGLAVARLLTEKGWEASVALLGRPQALKGAAAAMLAAWQGPVAPLTRARVEAMEAPDLVVDALFGTGLARDLDGELVALLQAFACPLVAVDIPSGVDGDSGALRGGAGRAALTVTFCRARPGQLLMPGHALCGELVVADIGIADETVATVATIAPGAPGAPGQAQNGPALWRQSWPWPRDDDHKHRRGHLAVAGGGVASSGAARLAARAGLRIGAGLVTCAVPPAALTVYAAHHSAVMNTAVASPCAFQALLRERRMAAAVLGPGQGIGAATRETVVLALATGVPLVLDADALTVFQACPEELFARLHPACVLTPHEGEFARLFARGGDRLGDVRAAAARAGCTVVLKGPDTTIARPDGMAVIDAHGSPFLATAGSGDVLAGFVAGLMAQGVAGFDAAAMAVWLHGDIARRLGPGLIAEDLPEAVPAALRRLLRGPRRRSGRRGGGRGEGAPAGARGQGWR